MLSVMILTGDLDWLCCAIPTCQLIQTWAYPPGMAPVSLRCLESIWSVSGAGLKPPIHQSHLRKAQYWGYIGHGLIWSSGRGWEASASLMAASFPQWGSAQGIWMNCVLGVWKLPWHGSLHSWGNYGKGFQTRPPHIEGFVHIFSRITTFSYQIWPFFITWEKSLVVFLVHIFQTTIPGYSGQLSNLLGDS